ncbi:MAG: Ig-like domain-containing protein [Prevotellaceae bacterium]|nr:Ig-like domain-containing protein [Prevotellaceae bacterium]
MATVDAATGEVTGIAEGTATVTATAGDKTATCEVTVIPRNDIFLTIKPGTGSEVRIYAAAQHLVVNWGDG